MSHLLHIDSSIQGDASTSRKLTAHAAQRWAQAHPGGTVTYRDLAAEPIPHFDAAGGLARNIPADQHTPAQAESFAAGSRSATIVGAAISASTTSAAIPARRSPARAAPSSAASAGVVKLR